MADGPDPERARLAGDAADLWRRWGPYLADRQWGTVREDYSPDGSAWTYLPHDHARSRAYRWGEDGLLGITDEFGRLCFAIALWNGRDPILKERPFGLSNLEGNHGEDVKERYWYLDATPTATFLHARYRYPLDAFPYDDLVETNARRTRDDPEYELEDTGVFANDRFVDVDVEYAKATPTDIAIRITLANRAAEPATIDLLPTLWFRNTWAWGLDDHHPSIRATDGGALRAEHRRLGTVWLTSEATPEILMTENETNAERLWGTLSRTTAVKDAFDLAIVGGDRSRLADPATGGTKAAFHHHLTIGPGGSVVVRLRLVDGETAAPVDATDIDAVMAARRADTDAFYAAVTPGPLTDEERAVQRAAFAGLVWAKQVYHYDVGRWLDGDPVSPRPAASRETGRNSDWRELNAAEVLSMPDPWEYPWFASWDLAFHMIPFALIDPTFAKAQLLLLTREWYMHPNGALPAYEWSFSDSNPPVHAWAAWRVYKIDRRMAVAAGTPRDQAGDRSWLERVFHKLLLNFTWWVNRKDTDGHNVFQGGFLGLDNIGVFDRSAPLPDGGHLAQADGTAWMGFYALQMMQIALELARDEPVYEDLATKFFEHFLYIASALNDIGGEGIPMWDATDGFFYDVLHLPDDSKIQLKVRSLVGLIPLLAVETLEPEMLEAMPSFTRRMRWFLRNRPALANLVPSWDEPGVGKRRLLSLVHGHRMKLLLARLLDEAEFLSPYGVRSLSRWHLDHPYRLDIDGTDREVRYEPAESRSGVFGGNSNWRGPIWFPIDYLLIEAFEKFHHYYGDEFLVEAPTGSGRHLTLDHVADDLADRLVAIFVGDGAPSGSGHGRDPLLFHEYFDGDTGAGLGASHQTGWTALVAKLLDARGRRRADQAGAPPAGSSPASSGAASSRSQGT